MIVTFQEDYERAGMQVTTYKEHDYRNRIPVDSLVRDKSEFAFLNKDNLLTNTI